MKGRVIIAGCALAGFGGLAWYHHAPSPDLPTVEAVRTELLDHVALRAETKAVSSVALNAPASAGELQIAKLAPNGSPVVPGDLIVQFDSSRLRQRLQERVTALRQAEAEVGRAEAENSQRLERKKTDLLQARYEVERARLEMRKQEILAPIEADKNRLRLADAERKLQETEIRAETDQVKMQANLDERKRRSERQRRELALVERQIAALSLRAPSAGVVLLSPNHRARAGSGPYVPEFKEGDSAWPGATIAELPDTSRLKLVARLEESDRGRLAPGQQASARLDAIPDREFEAVVSTIGLLARPDFSRWPPTTSFEVALELRGADPRLRPGLSATARVIVERIPGVLAIPTRACFDKGGRTVVYVQRRRGFEERPVVTARATATQVVVSEGLVAGDRIATVDPTMQNLRGLP